MKVSQMATAIAEKEGCPCRYIETLAVKEKYEGKTVWHGLVNVFGLHRPEEELCYAWLDDKDNKALVTVLHRPPVESPATAVRAYIEARARAAIERECLSPHTGKPIAIRSHLPRWNRPT
jgi:hypothetical protein